MTREEVALIGFQIVAYSGEARTKYLNAIKKVKEGAPEAEIQQLIDEAKENISKAHKAQTEMLAKEADGESIELGFIFVHGQDHLMTTILLQDILEMLMDIYK